jgi:hypothetical protein
MKVLLVEPGKTACEADIGNRLEDMQQVVGGYIEACYPYDDPVAIVCNEEGKLDGLSMNRAIYDDRGKMTDIMCGTFFVCGLSEDDFKDLPPELMEKYRRQFEHPEKFVEIQGEIIAVRMQEQNARTPPEKHRDNGRDL